MPLSDGTAIFTALKALLLPHAAALVVQTDAPEAYVLNTRHVMPNRQALFFGSVQIKKAYVSFHLMPVYVQPALLEGVSPALLKRMQGKSCFNFKTLDVALFEELGRLTEAGLASYRAQGYV